MAKPAKIAEKSKQVTRPSDQAVIAPARAAGVAFTVGGKNYTYAEMHALLAKAHQGDQASWAIVSEVYSKDPTGLVDVVPSPDAQARSMLLDTVLGKDLPVKASYKAHANKVERDLAGANASPLEHLLCQRIATCWLDANLTDAVFYSQLKTNDNSMSDAALRMHEYRRDRAHNRYITAVLTLAKVRRLLRPQIAQVNIAQAGAQQLNAATPDSSLREQLVTDTQAIVTARQLP